MLKYTVFNIDENYAAPEFTREKLSETLFSALMEKGLVLSACESFTAGRIAASVIEIPGASKIFHEGIVAYSNLAKINRLGVKKSTLDKYGAVSAECCAEMLEGLISTGNCDVAVSSTGIAGPSCDGTEKPVGLCFIGVAYGKQAKIYRYRLSGSREEITETAVKLALYNSVYEIKEK